MDYERSTSTTTLDRLPEPLRRIALERAESALIELPADAAVFLTHSVRARKPGLFGRLTKTADPDAEHDAALILTPRDVLVAIHGEKRGTSTLHARLEDCEISDLSKLQAAAGISDDGISLSGFPGSSDTGPASFWIGLGPPDGEAARTALAGAIRAAKRS